MDFQTSWFLTTLQYLQVIYSNNSAEEVVYFRSLQLQDILPNGLAERNVQTLKKRLKSMQDKSFTLSQKVREILFKYRTTPIVCGKSPAKLYLNRTIRIKLNALKPFKHITN